jgi:4-hydroxy-4-methyl-2-oxoglutarate aldolase
MDLTSEMISLILRNRISSVEVADALGKTGLMPGVRALNPGHHTVGVIRYIFGYGRSNWPIYEQIRDIDGDCILYIDTFDFEGVAAFGDIASKHLFLYKRVRAIVVNGMMRDAHRLRKENYPIWCHGVTPIGATNARVDLTEEVKSAAASRRAELDGGIMVCDDSGCVVIKPSQISEGLFKRLEFIELQEDIWYYCIDTLKWSLYDTICEKKYLQNADVLPLVLRKKLADFDA